LFYFCINDSRQNRPWGYFLSCTLPA